MERAYSSDEINAYKILVEDASYFLTYLLTHSLTHSLTHPLHGTEYYLKS
jgi:hypothetical protein